MGTRRWESLGPSASAPASRYAPSASRGRKQEARVMGGPPLQQRLHCGEPSYL